MLLKLVFILKEKYPILMLIQVINKKTIILFFKNRFQG